MAFFCALHLLTIGGQWSMVNQMAQREFFFMQSSFDTRFASPNPQQSVRKKAFMMRFRGVRIPSPM